MPLQATTLEYQPCKPDHTLCACLQSTLEIAGQFWRAIVAYACSHILKGYISPAMPVPVPVLEHCGLCQSLETLVVQALCWLFRANGTRESILHYWKPCSQTLMCSLRCLLCLGRVVEGAGGGSLRGGAGRSCGRECRGGVPQPRYERFGGSAASLHRVPAPSPPPRGLRTAPRRHTWCKPTPIPSPRIT